MMQICFTCNIFIIITSYRFCLIVAYKFWDSDDQSILRYLCQIHSSLPCPRFWGKNGNLYFILPWYCPNDLLLLLSIFVKHILLQVSFLIFINGFTVHDICRLG